MCWGLRMDSHLTRHGINTVRGHKVDELSLQWSLLYLSANVKRKEDTAVLAAGCEWLGSRNSQCPKQEFLLLLKERKASNDNYYP